MLFVMHSANLIDLINNTYKLSNKIEKKFKTMFTTQIAKHENKFQI